MCYKKRIMKSMRAADSEEAPAHNAAVNAESDGAAAGIAKAAQASMFCPNCSTELHAHRCKAICKKCGFYLSCSDPW